MGGITGGKSDSSSQQTQEAQSFVFPEQVPSLLQLYNRSAGLAGQQLNRIGGPANQNSRRLTSIGYDLLGQLGGGGVAQVAANNLLQNPLDITQGGFFENLQRLSQPNSDPFLQQSIDFFGDDIAQQIARQMPGVNQPFVEGGTAGGSRNQIAQGMLQEAGLEEFARGSLGLRRAADDRSFQASQVGLGGVLDAADIQRAQYASAGQLAGSNAALGLSGLSSVYDVALAPFSTQFSPLLNLAAALGRPTVLSESSGQQSQQSSGLDFGFNALWRPV